MAKKVTGGLKAKTGKYVSKHKSDETSYGVAELPGGIRNGRAKLVDCKFDKYKKGKYEGEYYFLAAGVVISPEKNDEGIPVKGLRTQIMIPVCDTVTADGKTTDTEEHVSRILNEMRKLGLDTSETDSDDLEEMAETLKEAEPRFRFSTDQSEPTEQFPNPRIWQNWHGTNGVMEEDEEEEDDDDVEEEEDDDDDIEEEEEEAGEEIQPKKGDIYFYKPPKKREKVEVEVVMVSKTKKIANLKNLEDAKLKYSSVSWSDLSYDPD